jgi:hypothetical protein
MSTAKPDSKQLLSFLVGHEIIANFFYLGWGSIAIVVILVDALGLGEF